MTLATGTQLGSYKILSPLGAGGMGEIYTAIRDRSRLVGLLLLCSSCAVGPDFSLPKAATNEAWAHVAESQLTRESVDYGAWWEAFNDSKLNELVELAYNGNLSLQIAAVRMLEARAKLGVARGLLWPQQQQLAGQAVKIELSDNAPNLAITDHSFWDFQVGFDAAWELDIWGRFRRGVEAADAGYLASVAGYHDALVTITAEVARAYVLLRTFEKRLELAERNVALQRDSLRIAKVRFRNGLVPELDVAQAKSLLSATEAVLPRLESGTIQTKHALSTLLGRAPGQLEGLLDKARAGTIPAPPPEVAVGAPIDLLRRRPDVRRAELEAAAQSAVIGIAESELYPRFTLLGSIGLATSESGGGQSNLASFRDLFNANSLTYVVGPSFTWPILNYGRLQNQVRVQDARFQQFALSYQNTVLNAAREVEDALDAFIREQVTARALDESVFSAERSVELAISQYQAGLVTYQRVVDTQRFLVQQQDRATESRGLVGLHLIAAYKALGGGWKLNHKVPALSPDVRNQMRKRTNWGAVLSDTETNEQQAGREP